jgi:DNA-binding transcriptional ArsR family regulator
MVKIGANMVQDTIKALNDPVRRKILDLLKEKPLSVGDILSQLDVTGATLSHHLKILKGAGLVTSERQGNFLIYDVNTSVIEDIISWLTTFSKVKGDEK